MCASVHAQYESRLDYFLLSEACHQRLLTPSVQYERRTSVRGHGWLSAATSLDALWTTGVFLLFFPQRYPWRTIILMDYYMCT
jgi:hypothetical protein